MKTIQDFKKLLRLNNLPEFEELTEEQKTKCRDLALEDLYKEVTTFKLPEKWKVAVTRESANIVGNWRISGKCGIFLHEEPKGFVRSPDGYYGDGIHADHTEITLEQFCKYVLKDGTKIQKDTSPKSVARLQRFG